MKEFRCNFPAINISRHNIAITTFFPNIGVLIHVVHWLLVVIFFDLFNDSRSSHRHPPDDYELLIRKNW